MSVKLKKINGGALGFELTDLEERMLKEIYLRAFKKLREKSWIFKTERISIGSLKKHELCDYSEYIISKALKRLSELNLVKVVYTKSKDLPYIRYRNAKINLGRFWEEYQWEYC